MEYKDYYKTLGVKRDASADEIKRAYRRLARRFHPDVSKEADAEERFKAANEAYEVLRDAEKRAAYDQLGASWKTGQEFRPPPGWHGGFDNRGGFGGDAAGSFSDFFENLFGGGGGFRTAQSNRTSGFARPGQDERAKILVSLEDAYHGASRTIQIQIPEIAEGGRVMTRTRGLKVKIPAGVTQGQQIRLAGQGGPGFGNGPKGDLYLEIDLQRHPVYRVEGKDIVVDLPITPWEAALGTKVSAPTLGGTVDLKVQPGSQTGLKLRLRGRGLPGKPPGDQYVILQIVTPPADSAAARDFYEKMSREMPMNPRRHLGV